eukprot:1158532-Pelagomonas_calceolata.AAC.26
MQNRVELVATMNNERKHIKSVHDDWQANKEPFEQKGWREAGEGRARLQVTGKKKASSQNG